MNPIREGDRGPAVEDVQRRLMTLGYDLGPTGVDGVFFGMTREAVRTFQHAYDLAEDGIVGDETWAALVDASFTLGDRMLYLRSPLLHGSDIESLQRALNSLGFACGAPDGIFGPYTERAVRELQRSCGLPADGIAGADTVRALRNLRHVWESKDGTAPAGVALAPARAAQVLAGAQVRLCPSDGLAGLVAERIVNLALAAEERADVSCEAPGEGGVVVDLRSSGDAEFGEGVPVAAVDPADAAASATRVHAAASFGCRFGVHLRLPAESGEEPLQRAAVAVLDGLCAALAR